jgi:methyltransferase
VDHATWTGTLLFVVLGILALERGLELALNRRHVRWLREQGAVFHTPDGFGLILAVQVGLFVLTPVEALAAPWGGAHAATWPLVGLLLLAQALRYWVIRTLGPRWCIRVATLPGKDRILGGPYRWLRHPNYLAVALETLALPLAFGAWATALVLGALQAVALARRIRYEDAALQAAVA